MNTRILVTVSYLSNTIVHLTREDGSVFQVIKAGEPFRVGNQMREFVPQFNSSDHKMHCIKFDNAGYPLEDVYLPRNRKVLWALTSGSARRGLFHMFREPQDTLDAALQRLGFGRSIISVVDEIKDVLVNDGGPNCGHQLKPSGYCFDTDATGTILRHEGEFAGDNHPNQFHRHCKIEPDLYKVTGGTYVIEWEYSGCRSGSSHDRIVKIVMAKDCDRNKVYQTIYNHYSPSNNPLAK